MRSLSADLIKFLTPSQIEQVNAIAHEIGYRWDLNARDKQRLPPGDWIVWLILAGRGFGKTRTGAETVRIWAKDNPIIHLVGATAADARDIMIEGESGLLSIYPKSERPYYEPSKRRVTFKNGAKAIIFTADEPDRLRGPQCYKSWADELAAWRYPEAWLQLKMGLRLGTDPQVIVTTTPRPTKIIKELVKDQATHVTKGTTYENRDNLAEAFFYNIINQYEGTRIGRQELDAEILEDVEGALWTSELIERNRIKLDKVPELKRIIVALDPAVTSKKDSDKTGIVVVGLGVDNHGYVLDDKSGMFTPNQWAEIAVNIYESRKADRVIGEVNNGGDMIEALLRNQYPNIAYSSVRATRGKSMRAEPVVSLYEQNKIHHVGVFTELEDQMTGWAPDLGLNSPDNMDALVWGVTELFGRRKGFTI